MLRQLRLLTVYLLLIVVGPALAQEAPVGWNKLIDAIRNTPVSQAESLRGRQFQLVYPGVPAGETLVITPKDAFKVTRQGDAYEIAITNPQRLLETVGPFIKFTSIAWRLPLAGQGDFRVDIEGVGVCETHFTFKQKGGGPIDLSQASAT